MRNAITSLILLLSMLAAIGAAMAWLLVGLLLWMPMHAVGMVVLCLGLALFCGHRAENYV